MTRNLLERPIFKLEDRRAMCLAVLAALFADKSCRFDFKGEWKKPTPDEEANWEARQTLTQSVLSYPSTNLGMMGAVAESPKSLVTVMA